MRCVPFEIDIFAGFGRCEGIISDHNDGTVTIEFQNKDKISGMLKSEIKTIKIPLKDLASVTMSKGWLGMTWMGVDLVLQGKDMSVLKDVPGMNQGQVRFGIEHRNVKAAEVFIEGLYEPDDTAGGQ